MKVYFCPYELAKDYPPVRENQEACMKEGMVIKITPDILLVVNEAKPAATADDADN